MPEPPTPDNPPGKANSFRQGAYRASVVIPTLDRPERLQECLQALTEEFPDDSEVVVVSDGGSRALFPDLSRFIKPLNLTVIHAEHGGPGHARNQALQQVSSDVVVFLDDDCLPHSGWLEEMFSAVSESPVNAVGGKTLNGLPGNVYATASQLVLDVAERDQRERGYGPVFFPSNNLAFPTAHLKALNGFNIDFQTAEDREICWRWQQAGYRLDRAPMATLSHSPKLSLALYWRKYVSYGEGAAKFHRISSGNWRNESIAFHLRLPVLAFREMSESGLKRRFSLLVLLLVWELANLTGFVKEMWKNRKSAKHVSGSGGSAT